MPTHLNKIMDKYRRLVHSIMRKVRIEVPYIQAFELHSSTDSNGVRLLVRGLVKFQCAVA